ncbi:hypothetical protein LTR84_010648 [Exophiala bonariae]|uniref:Nephrocystin 3-like N-terminal domain-containing protein n=1 Tax=Exophiala bonariae TaxID=1690606 RepID=A0AAV9MTB3_9EURO|nr:hypothetical protein LTR84_010648 [Exophiala bonariae]
MVRLSDPLVADIGFSLVYEPSDEEAVVDVIFVHGLGGHPFNTWAVKIANDTTSVADRVTGKELSRRSLARRFLSKVQKKNALEADQPGNQSLEDPQAIQALSQVNAESLISVDHLGPTRVTLPSPTPSPTVFWPRDLLPKVCSSARVLTYGYDSRIAKGYGASVNKNSIFQHATDLLLALERSRKQGQPIIWVAHSLGGIIVKQVLKESHNAHFDDETGLSDVVVSTIATVFIATPHQGSKDMATFGELARKTAAFCGIDNNPSLLRALGLRTPELEQSHLDFSRLRKKYKFTIKTFREGSGWKSLGVGKLNAKVVPDYSSTTGDVAEHAETLEGNHTEICRIRDPGDPNFVKLSGQLKMMCDSVRSASQNRATFEDRTRPRVRDISSPIDSFSSTCLKSLCFPLMHARRNNIKAPVPNTCVWFRRHHHYKAWSVRRFHRSSNRFLWIRGKPGAGKSTIMKQELRMLQVDSDRRHKLTPAFFFGGKEHSLLKTAEGLFRSLVFQLVAADQALLQLLVELWSYNNPMFLFEDSLGSNLNWRSDELKEFLVTALERRLLPPTMLLIDALDECDDSAEKDVMTYEAREIVYFLDELMITARKHNIMLDVLVSSRSWFQMETKNKCYEIVVDQCNQGDLKIYAESRFAARKSIDSKDVSNLVKDIVAKSSGIFLWARLVIDMLLHDLDSGKTLSELGTRLLALPKELDEIFRQLLVDGKLCESDRELATKIFQWVIFSTRNLRLREWHHILPMIHNPPPQTMIEWQSSCNREDQLIRRIQTLTMGLVDVSGANIDHSVSIDALDNPLLHESFNAGSVDGAAGSLDIDLGETRTVQFIHDSVRTFFLRDCFTTLGSMSLPLTGAIDGESHLMIIETCLNFLKLEVLDALVNAARRIRAEAEKATKKLQELDSAAQVLGNTEDPFMLSVAPQKRMRDQKTRNPPSESDSVCARTTDSRIKADRESMSDFDPVSVKSFSSAGSTAPSRTSATGSPSGSQNAHQTFDRSQNHSGIKDIIANGPMDPAAPKSGLLIDHREDDSHLHPRGLQYWMSSSSTDNHTTMLQSWLAEVERDNHPQLPGIRAPSSPNAPDIENGLRHADAQRHVALQPTVSVTEQDDFRLENDRLRVPASIKVSAWNFSNSAEDSITSGGRSIQSQQLRWDISALFLYTMDEIITHASIAQSQRANPLKVVKLFVGMWERFSLLRVEWETYSNLATFCVRHDLLSWAEAMLEIVVEPGFVFDLFSSGYDAGNTSVMELSFEHQLRHSALLSSLNNEQYASLPTSRTLLFDIMESQRIDLLDRWWACYLTLRERGDVSEDQILGLIHSADPISGESLLIKACRMFHFPLINALLASIDIGADARHILRNNSSTQSADNNAKTTPVGLLCTHRRLRDSARHADFDEVLSRLVEHGADINSADDRGNVPLHGLCRLELPNTGAIRLLLNHEANPNAHGSNGETPLNCLCRRSHPSIDAIELLLGHEADPNLHGSQGRTPLHNLCRLQQPSIDTIRILLGHNANPNAHGSNGETPLHNLCRLRKPSIDAIQILLDHGADPNIYNRYGETPLHVLCQNESDDEDGGSLNLSLAGETETFQHVALQLLSGGADPNITNITHKTPLWYAVSKAQFDLALVLAEHGADSSIPYPEANAWTIMREQLRSRKEERVFAILTLLIRSGSNVQCTDDSGMTPLHTSVEMGRHDIASLLVQAGVDTEPKNTSGDTPMHLALWRTYDATYTSNINELLKGGAGFKVKDASGRTASDLLEVLFKSRTVQSEIRMQQSETIWHQIKRLFQEYAPKKVDSSVA